MALLSASNYEVKKYKALHAPPSNNIVSSEISYSKYFTHGVCGGATEVFAKFVKRLQISLVKRISYYLDVHFVQILLGNAIDKERCYNRIAIHIATFSHKLRKE